MDNVIAQAAYDSRMCLAQYIALLVEREAKHFGLMHHYTDFHGNGPYMQAVISRKAL